MSNKEIDFSKIRPIKLIKSFLKLYLIGIGLGVITGSLLKMVPNYLEGREPLANLAGQGKETFKDKASNKRIVKRKKINSIKETSEIRSLSSKWERLGKEQNDLIASAYILFQDGKYAEFQPDIILPAASTIKIAILFILLEKLDEGNLLWNELLTLNNKAVAEGSGWMRYQKVGKSFPIHEVATEMIRISDNTATNLLIQRLGGKEIINKRMLELGLNKTQINNLLPDLQGTNTTSVKDLTNIIQLADQGNHLSQKSRDLFREVMSTSITNKLIPDGLLNGLGINPGNSDYKLLIQGFRVYNKTGDIGITYADAALLEMPDTSRAVVAFIVKGPFNDQRSTNLIRNMAASTIQYLVQKDLTKRP